MATYLPEVDSDLDGLILWTALQTQHVSRADLVQRTGLSRATLDARIIGLQNRGLLAETSTGPSTGGRRPRLVAFQKDAGFIVGVDLGLASVDVAVTDLSAGILLHTAHPVDVREGPNTILPLVQRLVEQVIAEASVDPQRIKGLGIGIPGPVETSTGLPISPPNMPGWHQFPIREYLQAAFGWRVFIDNDVNIMALGERWAGCGLAVDNFLWVKLGTGIGCGIICRGHIYRGADGCAGDIGHIAVGNEDVACMCGNTGCLGRLAGGQGLACDMEQAARTGASPYLAEVLAQKGTLTAVDLGEALLHDDPYPAQLVRRAGSYVGHALAGLVNFYNPSLIVIGGGLANLGDLLLASIREAIYRRSAPLATRHLAIQRSALGDEAGVVGAAALVLGEFFKRTPLADGVRVPVGSREEITPQGLAYTRLKR